MTLTSSLSPAAITSTASLKTNGGAVIARSLRVGEDSSFQGSLSVQGSTEHTGTVAVTGAITHTDTTDSTTSTTGAVTTTGGLGGVAKEKASGKA